MASGVAGAAGAGAYVPPPKAALGGVSAGAASTRPSAAAPSRGQSQSAPRGVGAAGDGTIEIKAQIMGMFYAQPEPGAPPFVVIGTEVKEDTTVCLIEVMKTFNAMTAGVKGVVTEICADNAQLVEYGQVLFRVRPS
jgi:biotin carboxyl carrier protein